MRLKAACPEHGKAVAWKVIAAHPCSGVLSSTLDENHGLTQAELGSLLP